MPSVSPNQMTFSFEPSLADRFPTLRAYIAHRVNIHNKSAKVIASDMDIAPSLLSRKLNPSEGDTQRFNLDDLESYLSSSGDAPAVIEYLASKFMDSPEARKARMLSRAETLLADLASVLPALKEAA